MSMPQVSRTTKIILMAEFVLVAYMLYVLSTSLYKSYQVDKFIQAATEENKKLQEVNNTLAEDFEYYQSQAYREKIIKQNFGLVLPGEEVIVLVPEETSNVSDDERAAEVSKRYYLGLSNPKKWFLFFFDRERFSR